MARDEIAVHYNKARKVALAEIQRLARKHLAENPHVREFVMCMGTYFFTAVTGGIYYTGCQELDSLFEDWDNILKLTGTPMRFTATGPVVTNW